MARQEWLRTANIYSLFSREIELLGGIVRDAYDDGSRLFLRSVLPEMRQVRRSDHMQGGVALRMDAQQICVHPYLFRLICKNGAIMAHALQTRHVDCLGILSSEQVETRLADAIRACASEDAFETTLQEVRSAQERRADLALNMMPLLARMPAAHAHDLLANILKNYFHEGDTSRFGLMNAVTAVARETTDPEMRWRLEEYGGGIPVATSEAPYRPDSAAKSLRKACEILHQELSPNLIAGDFSSHRDRELEAVA